MNRFITYLIFLFVSVSAVAQVNVTGTVVDKESNEPLTGASVIVKGADGKIKKYATSKLSNIFNQRIYNYTTYNQITSFESQRWLRGRELLISISLRK